MKLYFRSGEVTQVLGEAGGKLGRAEGSAVWIADSSVSSDHAEFSFDGEKWWILPLSDKNPVLRDGARLPGAKVLLGPHGTLQVGKVLVSFWVEGAEPKVEVSPQGEWQRLRLKEPPPRVPRNPPVLDLSMSQLPTLLKSQQSENVPATIVAIPHSGGLPAVASPNQPMPAEYVATPVVSGAGLEGPVAPGTPAAVDEAPSAERHLGFASASASGELLLQVGVLALLLSILCAVGFVMGVFWLG